MQKFTNRFCTGRVMSKKVLFLAWFVAGICPAVLAAQSYKSLNDKVQLQMENTTAAAVVKALQQQTKYTFIYDPEYLQHCKVSAPHFSSRSIAEVLRYLDENTPIDIEMTNGSTIALRRGRQERVAAKDGKITGKIVDNRNNPLPGVTVLVDGGKGTVSQADGTYELALAPGSYTITYSFISYENKKVTDVVVREDANTPLNVLLNNSGSSLKEVTVTANYKKASVEGLYALQKNNAAITDGISAEQISRTPDKNIGEVLKRVSGLSTMDNRYVVVRGLSERYNQAVLNGQILPSTELNRKNFNFDLLPSNIVENVTVVKTLTPDHSAEFGGGSVEVTTLDIPTRDFLNISAGGGYNDKTTGKDFLSLPLEGKEYRGQVSSHRYLFGSLNWSGLDPIIQTYKAKGNDPAQFSNNWGITSFKAQPSQNYQVSAGHVFNQKGSHQFGLIISGSYRNTLATQDIMMTRNGYEGDADKLEPGKAGFSGKRYGFTTNIGGLVGFGYRTRVSKISFQSMYLRTLDLPLIVGTGTFETLSGLSLGYYDLAQQTNLWQNQLKGEHKIGNRGIKVSWMGGYQRLDRQRPDNHVLNAAFIRADSTQPNDFNIANGGGLRTWSRALEKNYNWNADISIPFSFQVAHKTVTNTFKTGYAGWSKDRSLYVIFLNAGSGSSNYVPLAQAFTPQYNLSANFDLRNNDDYHHNAVLNAAYVMLDDKLGDKWRLVWGVRGEYYNLNKVNSLLDSTIAAKDQNEAVPLDYSAVLHREPNLRLFPSANLTYSLTPSMNLRLAYSESIIRPDLRELSYFRDYDFELGGTYSAGLVRSTTIKHLDFRYEWYPGPGEILSVSLFYKKLDYPMEIYKLGYNREYELENNKYAKNYGVELEARKSFAFTKVPVIKNITLYGNFTKLDSRVQSMQFDIIKEGNKALPDEKLGDIEKRPQTGASNYVFNAGFYYDIKPVTFSLTYNYVSNRMYRAYRPYNQSLFEQPLKSLDAQVAGYLLKRKLEMKLNVSNLLNSYSVVYLNADPNDPAFANGGHPSVKQMLYQRDKDFIDYLSRPGLTYTFSISYKF